MKRLLLTGLLCLGLLAALVPAFVPVPVYAQQTGSCTFTSPASSPCQVSGLDTTTGQWCHVLFSGPATGAIQAAYSDDGVTWTPISAMSRGGTVYPLPFTPNNGQVYDIAPQFVSYLRVAPASYFAGNVSGTLFCDYPAVTPTPSPTPGVFQIVAGPNITISPSGGKGIVTIQAIPAAVTPYPTPTIHVTSTPCGAAASGSGLTVTIPSACPGTTPNPLESALLARTDVTHLWEMHDPPAGCVSSPCTPGPCSTGAGVIADSVSGGATALPSPAPLAVVTVSPYPAPICGAKPSLLNTSGTSILFCQQTGPSNNPRGCGGTAASHSSYLQIPQAALPGSGAFTLGCLIRFGEQAAAQSIFYDQTGGANHLTLGWQTNGFAAAYGSTFYGGISNPGGYPWFVVFVSTGTSGAVYWNGIPDSSPTSAPPGATGNGAFGDQLSTTGLGWNGYMQDCFFANTAWSASTVDYFYSLTGL